eukprot:scaffold60851_cov57-Phaeocystis_antarctica.AAC.3
MDVAHAKARSLQFGVGRGEAKAAIVDQCGQSSLRQPVELAACFRERFVEPVIFALLDGAYQLPRRPRYALHVSGDSV